MTTPSQPHTQAHTTDAPLRVVVAGGGTAGHIEPALALADALTRRDPAVVVTALGTERGLESSLVPARGYPLELIPPVPIPRKPTLDLLRVPGKVWGCVNETVAVLRRVNADVVVGFGGYVAGPAYLAAKRAKLPMVVHEANPRPGWANRLGASMTEHVAIGCAGTRLPHAEYVGIPLRRTIAELDRAASRNAAREHFGLDLERPVLLVSGGSQGARSLNLAASGAAQSLVAAGVQVLHATGPAQHVEVPQEFQTPGEQRPGRYLTVPYLQQMDLAYAAADVMMCRAGAMTCAELAAVGLPGVFVPLPHGNGEQALNAQPLVDVGGGLMIADAELTPQVVIDQVLPLLTDRDKLTAMGQAVSTLGRRHADQALVELVYRAVGRDLPDVPVAHSDVP